IDINRLENNFIRRPRHLKLRRQREKGGRERSAARSAIGTIIGPEVAFMAKNGNPANQDNNCPARANKGNRGMTDYTKYLTTQVSLGRMNRREFMGRAAAFGITLAVAGT